MKYTEKDLYNGIRFKIISIWEVFDINWEKKTASFRSFNKNGVVDCIEPDRTFNYIMENLNKYGIHESSKRIECPVEQPNYEIY